MKKEFFRKINRRFLFRAAVLSPGGAITMLPGSFTDPVHWSSS
jgi:hypothetical protein